MAAHCGGWRGSSIASCRPTRVSVFSLDSYFEQVDLAAASVKLLPLVARRHVDAELVFDDASYRLRSRSRSQRERTIAADIAAMPEHDLDAAVSMLPLQQRPCLQMVPLELAIAALVGKATTEPVMVFWEKCSSPCWLQVVWCKAACASE